MLLGVFGMGSLNLYAWLRIKLKLSGPPPAFIFIGAALFIFRN